MLDRDALVDIFDTYSRPLYDYAFRMCSDPRRADRIVGEVFSSLLSQLSRGKEPIHNLRSYLYQVTYQLIVDEEQFAPGPNGHQAGLPAGQLDCWNELSTDQRHVVILRFLEGLSRNETAAVMGKKARQIKTLEYRAIDILIGTLDSGEMIA